MSAPDNHWRRLARTQLIVIVGLAISAVFSGLNAMQSDKYADHWRARSVELATALAMAKTRPCP